MLSALFNLIISAFSESMSTMYRKSSRQKGNQDSVSNGIWNHARVIDGIGRLCAFIIVAASVIVSFYMAFEEESISVFFTVFIFMFPCSIVLALVVYHIFFRLKALMLAGLAEIVNNTSINAIGVVANNSMPVMDNKDDSVKNVQNATTASTLSAQNTITSSASTWVCDCGARNQSSASSCVSCGKSKKGKSTHRRNAQVRLNDTWVCVCGKRNNANGSYCGSCGRKRTSE